MDEKQAATLLLRSHATLHSKGSVISWIAKIEGVVGVSPLLGTTSTCETGDPYVEIAWQDDGCFVWETDTGMDAGLFRAKTEAMAWKLWSLAFWLYFAARRGKIHWRTHPEITNSSAFPGDFFVYGRVFVEDGSQ